MLCYTVTVLPSSVLTTQGVQLHNSSQMKDRLVQTLNRRRPQYYDYSKSSSNLQASKLLYTAKNVIPIRGRKRARYGTGITVSERSVERVLRIEICFRACIEACYSTLRHRIHPVSMVLEHRFESVSLQLGTG